MRKGRLRLFYEASKEAKVNGGRLNYPRWFRMLIVKLKWEW